MLEETTRSLDSALSREVAALEQRLQRGVVVVVLTLVVYLALLVMSGFLYWEENNVF